MWVEEMKTGKLRAVERYTDPLTEKYKKVSITIPDRKRKTLKEAEKALEQKIKDAKNAFTQYAPEEISEDDDSIKRDMEKSLKGRTNDDSISDKLLTNYLEINNKIIGCPKYGKAYRLSVKDFVKIFTEEYKSDYSEFKKSFVDNESNKKKKLAEILGEKIEI